jgi:cell fate regulator YaaT (PSP1 superfamily)
VLAATDDAAPLEAVLFTDEDHAAEDALGGDAAPLRLADPPEPPRDEDGEDVFTGEGDAPPITAIANVAGVKFLDAGTIYEFDAGAASYLRGERVVVESDRGPVLGTVAVASRRMPSQGALRRILRRADSEDDRATERNGRREQEALALCKERVRARRLPMKLIRAEYALQGNKVLFYFASEERIDFRDLVKDLSTRLHGRIEMRQVGARDEAKMVGGIGSCGRELCCSTFLPTFAPVSIKMAKDQGLVLNPSKVAGQCGRLKCCLVYEEAVYVELRKGLPKVGKRVRTPAGDGKVIELDVLRQLVRVSFEEGNVETFPGNTVTALAPPGAPPAAEG